MLLVKIAPTEPTPLKLGERIEVAIAVQYQRNRNESVQFDDVLAHQR